MRIEKTTASDFLSADQAVTVCKLTDQFGSERLSRLATFQKLIAENLDDFKELMTSYLVWYKPNIRDEDGWEHAGTENYTIAEYMDYVCQGEIRPKDQERVTKIKNLKKKLESGLCKDILLVAAFDTKLNKRVIVDGCNRVVALALMAQENRAAFSNVLTSKYKIIALELKSRWAHSFYPCDFIMFLEECGHNIAGKSRTELRDANIDDLRIELERHR